MKPCSTRNTIMASRLVASAQPMLMSVKPAAEITNRTRVDMRRERYPENGIMMTSAIR
jgi:hypothetical protein